MIGGSLAPWIALAMAVMLIRRVFLISAPSGQPTAAPCDQHSGAQRHAVDKADQAREAHTGDTVVVRSRFSEAAADRRKAGEGTLDLVSVAVPLLAVSGLDLGVHGRADPRRLDQLLLRDRGDLLGIFRSPFFHYLAEAFDAFRMLCDKFFIFQLVL